MYLDQTLFGAAYYDEYMPYDRIETDFKLMKEAGMNVIRIAESTWSTWEPENNVFDFTHLHRMLDAALKYDINVIIGTPTYAVPAWLVKKYPDIMATTKNGKVIYGHRQIHNILNKDFLFHAERIIRKLLEEAADHPKVIGYQIDNETRSGDDASPETQKLWVKDLQEKYPDINDFNLEFGLNYWSNRINSWDDMPDVRGTINGSLSASFKAWHREQITRYQKWQSDLIHEYMRPDQFITHNYDYAWAGYSCGIQPLVNQQDAAEAVDIAGVDIYHLSQEHFNGATISFGGAIGRSMKKDNYLVLETQSQGRIDWLSYPGQLRQAYYSHLSSGANSVMYWNWHSIHNACESYWKGILSHDLLPNETYYELSETRKEALPIDKHLINLKKHCKVAILGDNKSLVGLDEFPIDDISNGEARDNSEWRTPGSNPKILDYNKVLRWFYDTCYRMNLEADIIYKKDVLDENYVNQYKVIIVPALYSADEKTIQGLRKFVCNGGHLIISFRSFFSDDELKIYPDAQPHRFTDLIGATYDHFTNPENTKVNIDGNTYSTSHWMEMLRVTDGESWGSYEHPFWNKYSAVVNKDYICLSSDSDEQGDVVEAKNADKDIDAKNADVAIDAKKAGSATYIGCFMEPEGLEEIIRKVCEKTEIEIPKESFPLIIKSGTNSLEEEILYYFNYSSTEVSTIYKGEEATDLLTKNIIKPGDKLTIAPWSLQILAR